MPSLSIPSLFQSTALVLLLPVLANAASDSDIMTEEKLAPLSTGPGDTLFEALPPEKTGVALLLPIDLKHPLKHLYAFGWATGGVAIGDVNGDGRPDLFFSGGPVPPRLYLQTGEMKFEDVTEKAGIPAKEDFWGAGAAMGDIDSDGDLDIYLTACESPNLLLVNESKDGRPIFAERGKERGADIRDACLNASFCDFDRDGDLDLYVQIKAAVSETGRAGHLLQNDGTGKFTDVTKTAGILTGPADGTSATWMDADNDGWPDLHVGNDGPDPDRFYLNNTGGGFREIAANLFTQTTWNTRGVAAGDFNHDLLVDLFAGNQGAASRQELLASGFPGPANVPHIAQAGGAPQTSHNVLQLNTGAARFVDAAWMTGTALTGNVWSVKAGDFDCDGRLDLFLATGAVRDPLAAGPGGVSGGLPQGKSRWELLEKSPERREPDRAFRNLDRLRFEETSPRWGLDHSGMSYAAGTGDLDGDGDLDLVVCRAGETVGIYRNHAAGNRISLRLSGQASNTWGVGAEVIVAAEKHARMRQLYPTGGFMGSDEPLVHFGVGNAEKIDRLTVRWPSGAVETLENLPANRRYTITEAISRVPPLTRARRSRPLFARGAQLAAAGSIEEFSRRLQPLAPLILARSGPGQAWGDFLGRGVDTLFLPGSQNRPGRLVHPRQVSLPEPPPFSPHAAAEDTAAIFFDADGDRDLDLFVAGGGVEAPADSPVYRGRLYLNQGEGRLEPAPDDILPDVRDSSGPAAAADFDRDGDVDLFVGSRSVVGKYPAAPANRLLTNDGAGKFTLATGPLAPGLENCGMTTSALWTDVDNDGWLDLMVACDWGPVRLWKNQQGKLEESTEAAGLAGFRGQWNGLAGRDLDNDGDIDYVATNTGLNTRLSAGPENPAEIFYGDPAGDGAPVLLETMRENGRPIPFRSYPEWSAAFPEVAGRFPSSREFAAAGVDGLFPPARRSAALHLAIDTLASSVLINDGSGRFNLLPLPPEAQLSPAYGVVLTDVNFDGFTDCCLAQNREAGSPDADAARNGVGLLLLGTGKTQRPLRPVRPDDSGIVITGPGRSLAVVDLNDDEKADLTAGINNAAPAVYVNQGTSKKNQPLKVRLGGRGKSPEGARVTAHCAGMPPQVAEYHAGGGYLSQSPPELFFGAPAKPVEPARIQIRWADGSTSNTTVYFDTVAAD